MGEGEFRECGFLSSGASPCNEHATDPFIASLSSWGLRCVQMTRVQGLEALFRVRVSKGLNVVRYVGGVATPTPTDADMPQVDADQALVAHIALEEDATLDPRRDVVHIQVRILPRYYHE